MYLTIERVLLLRDVDFFASIEDDVLAEVAAVLDEVSFSKGARIIERGELGSSMFIIVSGRVRVHDGDTTLAEFGPGQVIGELSALDPEPRAASISALEDTQLFRLDHDTLTAAMRDRAELASGIIRFLIRRYGRHKGSARPSQSTDS